MTVSGSLRTTAQGELAGGKQAANALQPDSSSRYAPTANAKVGGTIEASLLVKRRPCLSSHGRSHRFDPCHAHPSFPQVSR
jgi:hypothetical protein